MEGVMKRVAYFTILLVCILSLCIVIFVGCGTSRSTVQGDVTYDDIADIDELLGLADSKTKTAMTEEESGTSSDTIAEDDVLKLLGVVEESASKPGSKEGQNKSDLERQIAKSEAELAALNQKEQHLLGNNIDQEKEPVVAVTQKSESESKIQPTKEKTTPGWKTESFSDRYQEALQNYKSRNYRVAIQKFEDLLMMQSNNSLSDNCQYWIGESYYGLTNYQQAILAFEKVFSFTRSNKDDDSQLKLGLCYIRLNNKARAREEFQKLINNYPSSEYVSIARRFLSQID